MKKIIFLTLSLFILTPDLFCQDEKEAEINNKCAMSLSYSIVSGFYWRYLRSWSDGWYPNTINTHFHYSIGKKLKIETGVNFNYEKKVNILYNPSSIPGYHSCYGVSLPIFINFRILKSDNKFNLILISGITNKMDRSRFYNAQTETKSDDLTYLSLYTNFGTSIEYRVLNNTAISLQYIFSFGLITPVSAWQIAEFNLGLKYYFK